MRFSVFIATLLFLAQQAQPEPVRLGAWNIQDLHHSEGHNLRTFGDFPSVRRTSNDFGTLQKYRDLFGEDGSPADVIALQEIGTMAALERIFPSDQYTHFMSQRWQHDDAPAGLGDVYTAIAIRNASGVAVLERDDLTQLAMLGPDGTYTRAGVALLLKSSGLEFWFLSVHLKSGCPETKSIHRSTGAACETLWRQGLVLQDWISKKRKDHPVIIAGDFNRQFRKLEDQFGLWKAINGVEPTDEIVEPFFVKHPETVTRKCPTRKGGTVQPIDWFLVDVRIADQVVVDSFHETRWPPEDVAKAQNGRGLSDHCPISLDIRNALP